VFLGDGNYRDFLQRNAPQVYNPGAILDREGKRLGQHDGMAFYTIGQRKGLGISSPIPLYVLEKDVERNALIVGDQSALGKSVLIADQINWISGKQPAAPFGACENPLQSPGSLSDDHSAVQRAIQGSI